MTNEEKEKATIRHIVTLIAQMKEIMQEKRKSAFERQLTDQLNRFFLIFPGRR